MGLDAPHGNSDVSHPVHWCRLTKLAVSLPVMRCAEPHNALWVRVVDVVALSRHVAADLARLWPWAVLLAYKAPVDALFLGETFHNIIQ